MAPHLDSSPPTEIPDVSPASPVPDRIEHHGGVGKKQGGPTEGAGYLWDRIQILAGPPVQMRRTWDPEENWRQIQARSQTVRTGPTTSPRLSQITTVQ